MQDDILFYPKFRKQRNKEITLCPACNGKGLRPDGKGGQRMCVACKGIGNFKTKPDKL